MICPECGKEMKRDDDKKEWFCKDGCGLVISDEGRRGEIPIIDLGWHEGVLE